MSNFRTKYRLFDDGWRVITPRLGRRKKVEYKNFPEKHRQALHLVTISFGVLGEEFDEYEIYLLEKNIASTVGVHQILIFPFVKEVHIIKEEK